MSAPFIPYPMLMSPVLVPRPWGGMRIREALGKSLPADGGPFGESWEISDHPHGPSKIANGTAGGEEFGALLRRYPKEILGIEKAPARYPVMIKFLDAAENLSVQIHPDDAGAEAHGERGKSECWYIIDAPPGGEAVQGLKPGVTSGMLYEAALDGDVEGLLRRAPIQPGDMLTIPPGSIHALLAGTLVCEIQQTSNLTWRLWDWNRKPARELHIEQACAAIRNDGGGSLAPIRFGQGDDGVWRSLVKNPFFEIDGVEWGPGSSSELMIPNPHGLALSVVRGGGTLLMNIGKEEQLKLGQTWFLPAGATRWSVQAGAEGLRVLVSRSMEIGDMG